MTTITCKIPAKLRVQLEAAAREAGVPRSEIVRRALEQALARRNGRRAPRAWDLVKHLAGSARGPADLLTNRKYAEDFGA
jgi:hypothetical protein